MEPNMFLMLLESMRPGIAFVYGGYRYMDADGAFLQRKIQGRIRGDVGHRLLLQSFVGVGCLLLRRSVTDSIRFDPSYNIIGDFEMWMRLSAEGYKCDYVDACLTRLRVHGNNTSLTQAHRWNIEERRFYRGFISRYGLRYPEILFYIIKAELSHILGRKRI